MSTPRNGLYTIAAIRRIEQAATVSLPPGTLMQRAGHAAADLAENLLPAGEAVSRALILAGPGNNGGDAFVAAARLAEKGISVNLLFNADPDKLPTDAKEAYAHARRHAVAIDGFSALPKILEKQWDIVVDGLFGIGLSKAIASPYRELIDALNRMSCPILALDVPSGLDPDTGTIVGVDGTALRATHTITFIADKPGLHTAHGRDLAGIVHVASLGIDERFFDAPEMFRNGPGLFAACLRPRPHNSHKGSYGNVAVVGGARGMHGAAVLSARAALHLGAGRVYVGFLDDAPAYDGMQPELMCRTADMLDVEDATVIAGPGMGMSPHAAERLAALCSKAGPLVLDADALNLLAADPGLRRSVAQRKGATILTPHPLEAARLLSATAAQVQADRMKAARELARGFKAVTVLKGSGSVIARPDGKIAINGTGNPALATAGTGDVLAGLCGALLAQSCPAWEAALAAVWIHGAAADRLVEQGIGPVGMTAGELIPAGRETLNRLIQGSLAPE